MKLLSVIFFAICCAAVNARTLQVPSPYATIQEAQEQMAARVARRPELMRRRKAIIEHCFGTIKRSFGYDYFLFRGKRQVTIEVNLTVLAYNLKRACNLVGVPNLIAALN